MRAAEASNGAGDENISRTVDLGSLPASNIAVGNVAVRIPRHERPLQGALSPALGASIAASDAIPFALNEAMRQYAARQAADEDDEMAMIIIMMGIE